MMAKKEYIKMLKYGDWLEKYLNKGIEGRRFRVLFEDALNILGLHGVGPKVTQSKIFQYLEVIEEKDWKNILAEKSYAHEALNKEYQNLENIIDEQLGQDFQDTKEKLIKKVDKVEKLTTELFELSKIVKFLSVREKTFHLARALIETNRPWEEIFYENVTNENYPVNSLLDSYGGIVEKFIIEENKFIKKAYLAASPNYTPWLTILARMFIDFLVLGGQEYIGFCKRCDKFYLVQRKGKKKYCSDICRALAFKAAKSD
jgi:hypothetical protein